MEQVDLVRLAVDALQAQQIPYFLVGSLASGAYGDSRMTQDADIVVDLREDQVPALCAVFPEPEFYVSVIAARQAVRGGGQFNVIHPTTSFKIDFMIARRDDWGRMQLARRRKEWIFPDLEGYIAAPEDVILGKLWYFQDGRQEKHLRDIVAMIEVSRELIDMDYVGHWAVRLGLNEIWKTVLARVRPA